MTARIASGLTAVAVVSLTASCSPPDPRTPEGRPDGARLYALHCEGCHGPDGRKGAPEARLVRAERKSAAAVRAVVEQGRGVMPSWKGRLRDEQITAVVEYVQRLGPEASSGQEQGAD